MYQPPKYQKQDPQYIFDFIKAHPFATFVSKGENLIATHIPTLITGTSDSFQLYSHIANHNEQLKCLKEGKEALFIFTGAHAYVSSSWYKEVDISTWDYSAVHVNVKIKIQSKEELENSLQKLVQHFEQQQQNPIYFKDLPNDMVEEHIHRITGFWAEPFKIQGIAKWHQGFDKGDIDTVTKQLNNPNNPLAQELSNDIKKEHDTGN